jgi:uncharacterized membrane protein YbhN (UPF0104 family)
MSPVRLKLAIKCVVTVLLLWLAFRTVDIRAVSGLLSGMDPLWAAAALSLTALIVISDAKLFVDVMRVFSRRIQFGTALLYSLVGWFFSNVAPSTVGGDVFRGIQLSRVGMPIGAAVRMVLAIRVLSFVTLVAVIAAGFPIALDLLRHQQDVFLLGSVLVGGLGAIGVLFMLVHLRLPDRLEQWPPFRKFMTIAEDFRLMLVPGASTASAWFAALVQHILRVGVLAALSEGLGLGIPLSALFAFTTAALLMAMLPISFGGRGVREIAFVYLLGAGGVSAEAALTLSVAFGLLRVVVGVIGGLAWVAANDGHFRVDAPSV